MFLQLPVIFFWRSASSSIQITNSFLDLAIISLKGQCREIFYLSFFIEQFENDLGASG
jgi:hypothetical protein